MSRYLSIDFEQGCLYVTAAAVKNGAVQVERAITLPEIGALNTGSAAAIGRRLKEALKDAGIAPAPVLAAVGRERVVLKEIKYPTGVAASDEPALIRFQMSKELTEGGDTVVIDYATLPGIDGEGQNRALAFAIRKDVLDPLRTVCQDAGLKLAGIVPRSFGVAAALAKAMKDGAVTPPESATAPLAILVRGDRWGELVIVRGGQVAFARSLTGQALNSETAMLGEMKRNLAVYAGQAGQKPVQAFFVAEGDVPGGWTGRARAGLTIPVQAFDPIAGVESTVPLDLHGCFAGAVGLIALKARSTPLPINFLEPRQPSAKSDPGKRLIALVGIAAALILVTGLVVGLFLVSRKGSDVVALQNQKRDLDEEIKKLDDVSKRIKAVKDWEDKGVNWLDELYDLTARFPDPSGTEVTQLIGQPFQQAKNSKLLHVAELQLTIFTDTSKTVDTLIIDMQHDKHYSVGAKQSKGSISGPGSFSNVRKNLQFLFKTQIEHREPNEYSLKLNNLPPPESTKRRDRSDVGGLDILAGKGGQP